MFQSLMFFGLDLQNHQIKFVKDKCLVIKGIKGWLVVWPPEPKLWGSLQEDMTALYCAVMVEGGSKSLIDLSLQESCLTKSAQAI